MPKPASKRFSGRPEVSVGEGNPVSQTGSAYHQSVMPTEILAAFAPVAGRLILDGTLGGGGHSQRLLRAGAKIIGLDRDGGAIGYCIQHLVVYDGDTVRLIHANFRHFDQVLSSLKIDQIDGLLLDVGVSSAQLDRAERGFSFQRQGPLDMRMDRESGASAADLVNGADASELTRIFRVYGEEPAASKIASAIVETRRKAPFRDTLELAQMVERVVPKHGPRHPATRVFQALRIAVNDELSALSDALEASIKCLRVGGRLVVLTFHSLEDRIVKNFCRETATPTTDRPEWPAPRPNPRYAFQTLQRKALQPSAVEQAANPRARSAKLRVLERIS